MISGPLGVGESVDRRGILSDKLPLSRKVYLSTKAIIVFVWMTFFKL